MILPLTDAAGEVQADGKNQYLYDGDGRICAVKDGSGAMTGYLYNAEGQRVAKGNITAWSCNPSANGFSTTNDYVLGPGGEQVTEMAVSGGTLTWMHTNVWADGRLIATYDQTGKGLHFYQDDPLGTRRSQSDPDGHQEQTCSSLPYGDNETCSPTPTEHLFTGKERDAESGNDYFGARYYASSMGRFMSPDWSAQEEPVPYAKLDDPQSLNLYTYGLNNPLHNVDKDGHCDSSGTATANTHCQQISDLHVNNAMQQQIKHEEGLPGTKGSAALKVYKDGAGNLTVGWGHKVTAADHLKLGQKITKGQADKFFKSDLNAKESAVRNSLQSNGGHQFSQGEFNALVDLTYNGGQGMLTSSMSPDLMGAMDAGDYSGMSRQLRYTKDSAGNVEPGLVKRSVVRELIFLGANLGSQ